MPLLHLTCCIESILTLIENRRNVTGWALILPTNKVLNIYIIILLVIYYTNLYNKCFIIFKMITSSEYILCYMMDMIYMLIGWIVDVFNLNPLTPVDIDPSKYIGVWYEVMRTGNTFEPDNIQGRAQYTSNYTSPREIKVNNSSITVNSNGTLSTYPNLQVSGVACIVGTKKDSQFVGRATVMFSPNSQSSFLSVLFSKVLSLFQIRGFPAPYWVIYVHTHLNNYDYAIVTDPTRKSLWILGRNSQTLKSDLPVELVDTLYKFGFDVNKLQQFTL
jgi:apolipoprotein D and lipocalin family protein